MERLYDTFHLHAGWFHTYDLSGFLSDIPKFISTFLFLFPFKAEAVTVPGPPHSLGLATLTASYHMHWVPSCVIQSGLQYQQYHRWWDGEAQTFILTVWRLEV
jgi:hypothetical protein